MPEPLTWGMTTGKAAASVARHVGDHRGRRALVYPGLTAPRTKSGGHGPAIMFHDPWTNQFKVSIASDVRAPRRLELADAIIDFSSAGDRVRWSPAQFRHTAYVNAHKEFVLVFSASTVRLQNVGQSNAILFVRYYEESRGKSRPRYAAITCKAGDPVQLDPRHLVPIWRLQRAGASSWIRHGLAAFT